MKVGYQSDIGILRENNEDSLFVDAKRGIFILADGMGGHQGGEVASKMAVDIISSFLKEFLKGNGDIPLIIHKAIQRASREIYMKAGQDANLAGMGTTIVLAIYTEDEIYLAHVGDSRAYLVRGNVIKQVTEDHSLVATMVKAREITKEDVPSHHLRHILTKALGSEELVEPDIMSLNLHEADYFLLCTDGLTDAVTDEEIRDMIFYSNDLQKTCKDMVLTANKKSGKDNISVILICNN